MLMTEMRQSILKEVQQQMQEMSAKIQVNYFSISFVRNLDTKFSFETRYEIKIDVHCSCLVLVILKRYCYKNIRVGQK